MHVRCVLSKWWCYSSVMSWRERKPSADGVSVRDRQAEWERERESTRIVNNKQLRHWNLITSNRSKGLWTAVELNGWMDAHIVHIQMNSCEITAINTLTNGMNMLNALCGKCVLELEPHYAIPFMCVWVWCMRCMWKVIGAHVEFHTHKPIRIHAPREREGQRNAELCLFADQVNFSSLCIFF